MFGSNDSRLPNSRMRSEMFVQCALAAPSNRDCQPSSSAAIAAYRSAVTSPMNKLRGSVGGVYVSTADWPGPAGWYPAVGSFGSERVAAANTAMTVKITATTIAAPPNSAHRFCRSILIPRILPYSKVRATSGTEFVVSVAAQVDRQESGRYLPLVSTTKLHPRVPLIITVALAWAAVVDIPTEISVGPMSLSGAATLIVATGLLLLLPAVLLARSGREAPIGESDSHEPYLVGRLNHASLPVSLRLFAVLALALLAMSPSINGLQNTAVYIMFIVAIPVTAASCSAHTADWTIRWARVIAIIVGSVAAGQSLMGVEIYGPRSVGLMLVVFVAITLVLPKRAWFDWALPLLLVVACALTLSRTALFVSAILIPVSFLFTARRNGILKVLAIAIPIYYAMYLLVTTWEPLRDRFLQGDAAYVVGGLTLNTSGRAVLWDMTSASWRESPLLGKGPGSASALISSRFNHISHPHNDYLRILHDFGLIGFVPFVVGFLLLMWAIARRALRSPHPIHKAAALALIGVAAVAFTDNVLIYPFVMLPVAVLVGLSVAYPLPAYSEPTHAARLVSA